MAIIKRCRAAQKQHGKNYAFAKWCAVAQVRDVLSVNVLTARALVTEHMAELNGNWKMLLDKLDN